MREYPRLKSCRCALYFTHIDLCIKNTLRIKRIVNVAIIPFLLGRLKPDQIDRCMRKRTIAEDIAKNMLANHADIAGGRVPEWPSDAPTLMSSQ